MIRNLQLALLVVLTFGLSQCSDSSYVKDQNFFLSDLSDFDPEEFNSGGTFEYLVNPMDLVDGEEDNETVEDSVSSWLDKLDRFSEEHEDNNFVSMQRSYDESEVVAHNENLKELVSREVGAELGYTKDQAYRLYRWLVAQEQVHSHSNYDPDWNNSIGFCFGRAIIVHSFAKNAIAMEDGEEVSKKGVPVRKIWAAGRMGKWKHHVATMVLAKEEGIGFWVVDNYVGSIVSAADWIDHMQNENKVGDVIFNVTRANRFSEANSLRYYQVWMDDPFFNSFFQDFLQTHVPAINENGGVYIDSDPISGTLSAERRRNPSLEAAEEEESVTLGGETRARRNRGN